MTEATPPSVPVPPPLTCPQWTAWVKRGGLAVLAILGVLLLYNGDIYAATFVLGYVLNQVGVSEDQQASLILTLRTLMNSLHASQVAGVAAHNTEVLKEAVRDIQDNPGPGTPGWMVRHETTLSDPDPRPGAAEPN